MVTEKINDCVIHVATVNGSGSQSANNILIKSIFRMGVPVEGKNLFPSNIAGLPTWFTIRANHQGFTGRKPLADITVAMNVQTVVDDIRTMRAGGYFFFNDELRFERTLLRSDVTNVAVPFRQLVEPVSDSVKLKKLLTNMIYFGVLARALGLDWDVLSGVVRDVFKSKDSVVTANMKAVTQGWKYAEEHLQNFPLKIHAMDKTQGQILIDGNTAAGLGLMYGGCTFMSWYPITPSSSLADSFTKYAGLHRKDSNGKNTYAIVQAEDELSAITMAVGAGWAGARAVTASSGPGLSLMAEAAGLAYFAEIPCVMWDVQRVGPSTGLPTRTMQGDVLSAHTLSHGDTQHPVLLPGTVQECFEFAQTAFDVAERLQTFVVALSDLDLGMNLSMSKEFREPTKPFDRGKVLSAEDLERVPFARYRDVDGDGICYRTLPGTAHDKAAYFTRGTGHGETSAYTEDGETFRLLMDRLKKKIIGSTRYLPAPESDVKNAALGLIAYGSSHRAMDEVRALLSTQGLATSYLRLRALPLHDEVGEFIAQHQTIYVIEQNRDAQMLGLIQQRYPSAWSKLRSVLQYDGLPLTAETVVSKILAQENKPENKQ